MSDMGHCGACRHWAGYGDGARWGECTMAERGEEASLHVLGMRVGSKPNGPFMGPPGRRREVSPGCFVVAVLMTDASFGCTGFDARGGGPAKGEEWKAAGPGTCACPSTDARRCYTLRAGIDYFSEEDDGRCECGCHERDDDEEPEPW